VIEVTGAAVDQQDWREKVYVATAEQMLVEKLIVVDENGDAHLTEKGKTQAAKIFDKLSTKQEILLNVAFGEHHDIPMSLF
jgi:Mn-dependent DtxR family transcriptional regulator